jgi:Recombination endonuclease VII
VVDSVPQKRCYRCKQLYPLDTFSRNRSNADGKADECKRCAREIQSDRYKSNKLQDTTSGFTKCCSRCKEMKPISDFWGSYQYCKTCARSWKRKYYQQQGGVSEQRKLLTKHLALKRNFNLSLEEYEEMFQRQKGVCAICGQPETYRNRLSKRVDGLAVDHCHKTGLIRELLCRYCNAMLGNARDNPEIMKKAIAYLGKHNL